MCLPSPRLVAMPDRPTDEMQVAVDKLSDEFAGVHDRTVVERAVQQTRDKLVPAKVDAFLPLLVHRYARESLRSSA